MWDTSIWQEADSKISYALQNVYCATFGSVTVFGQGCGGGRTVLFLSAGEASVATIRSLRSENFRCITVDRNPRAPAHEVADAAIVAGVDDVTAVLRAALYHRVDAIVPGTEAGVVTAAIASAALHLPGIGIGVALNCTMKSRMRVRWKAAGLPQPEFTIIAKAQDLPEAIVQFGLPAVLKPANCSGSRGVGVMLNTDDVEAAVADAVAAGAAAGFIIERFVPGPLLSADGFIRNGRARVAIMGDADTESSGRARVNMRLTYPTAFGAQVVSEACALIESAVIALGLDNSAFHCECIVGAQGLMLVELGARGGGSYISSIIVEAVSGIAATATFARLLLGDNPPIEPNPSGTAATLQFISVPEGIFRGVEGVAQVSAMPGIRTVEFSLQPGERGGPVTHDNARHGVVVAFGSTREQSIEHAREALGRLSFHMECALTAAG